MSAKDQHLRKASRNEEFVKTHKLIDSDHREWAVVALFYSALHYVEAFFLAKHGRGYSSHKNRTPAVRRQLSGCYRAYRRLKYDSEEARYRFRQFTTRDLGDDIIPNLEKVKETVLNKLK